VPLEEQATSSIVQSTIDHLEAYLSKMARPPASESSDSNSITIDRTTERKDSRCEGHHPSAIPDDGLESRACRVRDIGEGPRLCQAVYRDSAKFLRYNTNNP
jgi:hypothetical protein